jgi:hypothetical protein
MFASQNKGRVLRELKNEFFNSRFLAISVLFHAVLVLVLGGTVIMNHTSEPADFTGGDGDSKFIATEAAPSVPPPPAQETPTMTPTVQNNATMEAITTAAPAMTTFQIPTITPVAPVAPAVDSAKMSAPAAKMDPQQLSSSQAARIRRFTEGWSKPVKAFGGLGSSVKEREFEFVAYLAKYADGDWASTNIIQNGQIVKGSLPNLLYFMNKLSKGHIKASPIAQPLDLASEDIFVKKPPFIFFTGHRDFTLSDKEVENLQKYVQSGGCIWGDSSLPGRRSRFDLAFRREMRRVIPDADKEWEILPANYPMFTKNLYYQEVRTPPPGVNYYKEPVYALRYGGEVAIIYTANDYGDMWRLALNEELKVDLTKIERTTFLKYTDDSVFARMDIYYRGMELPKIVDSYKFGANVVVHLLTRWEDRLKTVPAGL